MAPKTLAPPRDAPTLDPHVRLLREHVVLSWRLKPKRWERCAGSPEAQPLLRGFLEGAAGQPLLLLPKLPASPGKVLFFLYRGPGLLSAPPGPRELLYRDLPASSLEHFAALVEEVRGPCVGTPSTGVAGWKPRSSPFPSAVLGPGGWQGPTPAAAPLLAWLLVSSSPGSQ
uniref:Uncharacterized protein n=1 Tax=Gopherus evgoodei TaxID=1825980 RepID=A0A8C4Y411_9SAUR